MWSSGNLSGNKATRIGGVLRGAPPNLTPFLCQPFVIGIVPGSGHLELDIVVVLIHHSDHAIQSDIGA